MRTRFNLNYCLGHIFIIVIPLHLAWLFWFSGTFISKYCISFYMNHFLNNITLCVIYIIVISICQPLSTFLILVTQFHVHLIHRKCFDIISQYYIFASRQVISFLVLNFPCKGTCIVNGKNIGSS